MSDFCCDNLERLIETLEERAAHSPMAYVLPDEEGQQALYALCQGYWCASRQQRTAIRSAVHGRKGVLNQLMAYVHRASERVQTTKDIAWLQIGTAAALLSGQLDYRDFLLVLAELYVTAEEAGLDPGPVFDAAGGGIPSDFHTYAVVRSRRAR
jgi:hypothetical protein